MYCYWKQCIFPENSLERFDSNETDGDFIQDFDFNFTKEAGFDPLKFLTFYQNDKKKLKNWFYESREMDPEVLKFFEQNLRENSYYYDTEDNYVHRPYKDDLFFKKLPEPTNEQLIRFFQEGEHETITRYGFESVWEKIKERIPTFTEDEKDTFVEIIENAVIYSHWPIKNKNNEFDSEDIEYFKHPLVQKILIDMNEDEAEAELYERARTEITNKIFDLLMWYGLDYPGCLDEIQGICLEWASKQISFEETKEKLSKIFMKDGPENFDYDVTEFESYINDYFSE